ncbi:MAG: DUF4157 domain-containing protein [Pseudonocardiaceae bacterium]
MSAVHDHERDHVCGGSLRPKAARLEEPESALQMRAALSGRLDAVTPQGVLGLQRTVGNAGTAALLEEERSPVHDVISGSGEPLAHDVREDMEGRLGHDFQDVRVHSDETADASARSVNANAYTVGSHIVFQRSAFDPGSPEGRTTLAHELTHVVQQRNGPVDGTPTAGGISVSDPSDRFEREAATTAERAMAAPAPAAPATAPAQVQRQAAEEEPEEEPVQGSFVQRAEGEELEEEPAG